MTINSTLPNNITENFTSYGGIGPLDMQFRTFQTDVIQQVADGAVFTQGVFQYQQTVSTSGTPFATSNLIIDKTETHGVRILNMNSPYLETGGNWTQHAIWIEPVTECVDHNVTYDFTVPDATPDVTTPQLSAQAITDRGRFANFNLNNYQPNQSNARNSSLQAHAYQAANYALKTGACLPGKDARSELSELERYYGVGCEGGDQKIGLIPGTNMFGMNPSNVSLVDGLSTNATAVYVPVAFGKMQYLETIEAIENN
ncbi:hypothetical protein Unana1_03673 [Umbelopsis nana]